MVNTSTLSNHDKYKYFTVYFLIPAYSFQSESRILSRFGKPDLKKRPEDRDRIRTRGYTLPNLFIFITPLNINNLLGLLLYKVSLKTSFTLSLLTN